MWWKEFKDYPPSQSLKRFRVESGNGLVGCEMHDLNGWGEEYHRLPKPRRKGLFVMLWAYLFGTKVEES